jgi:putative membrane-bound dehydrogenase-like protein
MRTTSNLGLLIVLGAVVAPTLSLAQSKGLSPLEARDRMVVPAGFHVEVFASEPEIRQPVAACFDERGRMWVIEYLQYPTPAGLVPVKVDQYLRTEYDRVPEPPPKGPKGADRIKILEDTDGDGKADKVTTFLEGLNLASGIAVGHGGVYVGQAPYLLFYPDRNRDDKPDSDPEVLVSGFGLQDAHATVNSLTWGPDGWLYGAQGSTVTAKIQGIEFQQGIWRFHPKTHKFELFAEGGGNTWGLDFDRGGNAFGSSNGSFIAFHMVQGANYWKGFAKHGPLHNPHAYGYFDAIPFTGTKPGGHVTPGGIIYKGEQFPAEYRGAFIGANLLSNSVYWYKLAPKGSTFTMTLGGTLLDSKDPWFRPIDLLTGPDGSVYVVDWYDKRASHLDPRDTWDRSNGRIYKITYGKAPKVPKFDLAKLSSMELIAKRNEANDWWAETARRVLSERGDFREAEMLLALVQANHRDEALALRDLFALNACDGLEEETLIRLLGHPLPGVRRWAVRLLGDRGPEAKAPVIQLRRIAGFETDPTVRSQLAASCGRWSKQDALDLLARMTPTKNHDADDPYIPLQMWWAVESVLRTDPKDVVLRLLTEAEVDSEVLSKFILPRVIRDLAEDGTSEKLALCGHLLDAGLSRQAREAMVISLDRGLEGTRVTEVPTSLQKALDHIEHEDGPSPQLQRVSIRLGSDSAYESAIETLANSSNLAERLPLIELLGMVPKPAGRAALLRVLKSEKVDQTIQTTLTAIGHYADEDVAVAIVERYPSWTAGVRNRAIDILSSRKSWSARLIEALAAKQIKATDLSIGQAKKIAAFGDAALTAKLEAAWGRLPSRDSSAKIRRIAEIRGVLPEGDKGVAARGQAVFKNACAACHRLFGEGERIGPELTGAERGDLDFLLTSLVDPNAIVRKEYQGQTIALKDGRVLTGMVVDEDGKTLTLFDSQKQKTTIAKSDIEERKAAEASVMPEGLLDPLTEEQVRDLFRYLQKAN